MLVLSRQKEQDIVIGEGGEQIRIRILGFKPNGAISLGIDAPKHMRIMRLELLEREERKSND